MIKIENLELKTYKNYNELCDCLEIPNTRGDTKIAYLKELARYCNFYNQGYKIIIDEFYDTPIPKVENRGGANNNKYSNYLDNLIIKMLLDNNRSIEATFTKIFSEYIPLFSNGYKSFTLQNYEKLAEKYDTTEVLLKLYYNKTRNKVSQSFVSALNRLQKQNIIKWNDILVVKTGSKTETVNPDDKLYQEIKEIEKETSKELDKTMYEIWGNAEDKEILLNSIEKKLNVTNYWKQYSITLIANIKYPTTDIKELKRLYIISIHKGIINKPYKNEFCEIFYPYKAERHLKAILQLDKMLWLGEEIFDDKNYEFSELSIRKTFNNKPIEENEVAISDAEVEFPF